MKSCPRCKSNSVNTTQPSVLLEETGKCLTCGWVQYAINPPVRMKRTSPFAPMQSIAHYDGNHLATSVTKDLAIEVEFIYSPYQQEKLIFACACPFCQIPMKAERNAKYEKSEKKRTQIRCPNNHSIYLWTDDYSFTWQ